MWTIGAHRAATLAVSVCCALASTVSGASAQTPPKLSPTPPADLPLHPTQADAVAFAWQAFVAVNWPAVANQRGVPDPQKKIGQPGDVVWTTWKQDGEVFMPNAQTPAVWNTYGLPIPPQCTQLGAKPGAFVLQQVTKVVANSPVLQNEKQVVGGTLTDQHGNLARYEIRLNRTDFDEIVAKKYYDRVIQEQANSILLPTGVVEAKAAWRMMTPADSVVRSRFYLRTAFVYTPANAPQPAGCVQAQVGLVALHIAQKTPSRPQWVWTTFEQVDNVPPFGSKGPVPTHPLPYSFNNPNCDTSCKANKSTENPPGHPTGKPTQVTRTAQIATEAQAANAAWQKALAAAVPGSPFAFYQLIDAQWKDTATAAQPTPFNLRNSVLETYLPQTSSCFGCHFTATTPNHRRSTDYSWVLAEAQAPAARSPAKQGGPRK